MPPSESPRETLDEFARAWNRLRIASEQPQTVVVVEGTRDERSLRRLGLTGPIALIHRGRSLSERTREIGRSYREAIVLTDWDRTGGQLATRLGELLLADGVRVDRDLRRRLGRALRGEVVHVEGIAAWAEHLSDRCDTTWAAASTAAE